MKDILEATLGWAIFLGLLVSPYFVIKWLRAADRRSEEKNARRLAAEQQRTRTGMPGRHERSFLKACTNCGVFALTLPWFPCGIIA